MTDIDTFVEQLREELESIVDRTSLPFVLEALARMCGEKADHLRSNWQDSAPLSYGAAQVGNSISLRPGSRHKVFRD